MKFIPVALMVAAVALTSPAQAENPDVTEQKEQEVKDTLRRQEQDKRDRDYRAATERTRSKAQGQKAQDPWAKMR